MNQKLQITIHFANVIYTGSIVRFVSCWFSELIIYYLQNTNAPDSLYFVTEKSVQTHLFI